MKAQHLEEIRRLMSGDIVPPKGLRGPMIEGPAGGLLPGNNPLDGLDFAFGDAAASFITGPPSSGRRCSSPSFAGSAGRTPGMLSSPGSPCTAGTPP